MKEFFAFFIMISFTVAANLALKTGSSLISTDASNFLLIRALNRYIVLGLGCFALAAIFYILILRWLPLNLAQSFASAQFIAVIIASWLFLGESINLMQWVGIIMIATGIIVVGCAKG